MLAVALIAFSLFRYVGDPVLTMVGQDTTQEQREALRKQLGLSDPMLVQYGRFVAHAAVGEFGVSYKQRRPVIDMFIERAPATLELSLVAASLAVILGIFMGVYSGLNREGPLSRVFQAVSLVGISLPPFLVGILLIYLFAVILGWLPAQGRGQVVRLGWWTTGLLTGSGIKSLILPSITLGLFQMTLIMRLVRSEMLEVLRTDYIKFARARGLTNRALHFGHALKNTLVPVITVTGLQIGQIIAYSIITETVFQWPGMGYMFLQAVTSVDIPVMGTYLVLVAALFVTINLIVDCLYYLHRSEAPRGSFRDGRLGGVMMRLVEPILRRGRLFLDGDIFYSFRKSPVTLIAAGITAVYLLVALFAPLVAPHNAYDLSSLSLIDGLTPPVWYAEGSANYLLGTDDQGRCILSTIIYGSRLSLAVGFAAVLFSGFLGVLLGLISGSAGGAIDALIMRVAEIQMTFPAILIALLVDGIFRGIMPVYALDELAVYIVIFSIGVSSWPQYARTVRASTIVENNKEYVAAARVIGIHPAVIMFKHVLPNVMGPVLVIGTINLALAIILEATLSFLGVGIPPTQPSLGSMIRIGNDFLFSGDWWITVFPGAVLAVLVLAVNLLGDWMRDAFNPRLR